MRLQCVCFTLIVDDIIFPDGGSLMGVLGGGGPQSLFGFQLIHELLHSKPAEVALVAGVGSDLPPHCKEWLVGLGADEKGLLVFDQPTPRAWQILEEDGRRTQIWRGISEPSDKLFKMLRPPFDMFPPEFQQGRSYHVGIHPLYMEIDWLAKLRATAHANGGILSIEPFTTANRPPSTEELTNLLTSSDIFSPNEGEAASIIGECDPHEMMARMDEGAGCKGPRVINLRRGEHGAVVLDRERGEMWQIPTAQDTHVVDVTGCGNAFCGGFLASWQATHDILTSGVAGCVAASIMAEHQAVPPLPIENHMFLARRRMEDIRKQAVRVPAPKRMMATTRSQLPMSAPQRSLQPTCRQHPQFSPKRAMTITRGVGAAQLKRQSARQNLAQPRHN